MGIAESSMQETVNHRRANAICPIKSLNNALVLYISVELAAERNNANQYHTHIYTELSIKKLHARSTEASCPLQNLTSPGPISHFLFSSSPSPSPTGLTTACWGNHNFSALPIVFHSGSHFVFHASSSFLACSFNTSSLFHMLTWRHMAVNMAQRCATQILNLHLGTRSDLPEFN